MGPLTRQQVRAIDRYAIEQLGVPGIVLMENAGLNAAHVIASHFAPIAGKTVLVVAGKGNNGGDGYIIARHLTHWGAEAIIFLACDPLAVGGDAKTNLEILHRLGLPVVTETGAFDERIADADIVVDALGGTGIQGPVKSEMAHWVDRINAAGRPIVAVDIPTGLDCDTGQATGSAVEADLTVTFVAEKAGFAREGSGKYTGMVVTVDIGVDAEAILARMDREEDCPDV